MQDNYPNIDKKFTDKGWAAMRDLLDEELPVDPPKRKRRGVFFFLLLAGIGLGIAIGLVAGGFYFNERNQPQETQQSTVEPIAQKPVQTDFDKKEDTSKAQSAINLTEENDVIKNIENSTATKNASSLNSNVKNTKSSKKGSRKATKQSENVTNILAEINPTENITTNDIHQKRNEIGKMNIEKSERNEEKLLIEKLENKELAMLNIILDDPTFNLNIPKINDNEDSDKDRSKKGRFGLELASSLSFDITGITGGLVYAKPINNKWSVQIGANYAYQRRTFEGEQLEVIETAGGTEITYPGLDDLSNFYQGNYDEAAAQADSSIFTIPQKLSLHYLNIPIRINYQISDKWSVSTGVTGSILLLATDNYTDGGLFNRADSNKTSFTSLDQQKSINKANLQQYDLAATIGIGFHPTPKWSVTANYHHGFNNLFKYSSDTAYNRYFNLGIQYYFGK